MRKIALQRNFDVDRCQCGALKKSSEKLCVVCKTVVAYGLDVPEHSLKHMYEDYPNLL